MNYMGITVSYEHMIFIFYIPQASSIAQEFLSFAIKHEVDQNIGCVLILETYEN